MAAESGTENLVIEPEVVDPGEFDARSAPVHDNTGWRYRYIRKLLETVPFEFQFFQAVRLLERLQPERQAIGRFVSPRFEAVRFAATPRLAFPASQVHGLTFHDDNPPVMLVMDGLRVSAASRHARGRSSTCCPYAGRHR